MSSIKKLALWGIATCCLAGLFYSLGGDSELGSADTIYYEVPDLVGRAAPFETAGALAEALLDQFRPQGKHAVPCVILGVRDKPELIVWGTRSEHRRFKQALSDLRDS